MALFKINKTKNYTVMSNYHLRDKNLSLKAKGLLSLMLSLPEDWDYSIQGLVQIVQENETAVKSALNELMRTGYLVRLKLMPTKDENGNVIRAKIEYEYNIYEKPNQESCNQGIENLGVENQGQINKEVQSKENKKETVSKDTAKNVTKFKKPTVDEVREYCEERKNNIDAQQFVDYYESKGWLVGKSPMKDWKACVRTWERNRFNSESKPVQEKHNVAHKPSEYQDFDIKEYYKGLKQ